MATVDDLLRRMHRQAARLRPTAQPSRQLQAHLLAWIPLAANARRLLEALDPRPGQDPELYGLMESLSHWRGARVGQMIDPDLAALALTLGVLGDVVNGSPKVVAQVGQGQRTRLQANIRAAIYAAARATIDIADAAGQNREARLIHEVAEATELAALLPPQARVSALESLTVTRLTPDTVDGAVQLWTGAAERVFTNYNLITGVALQEAAATLALLCQAAANTMLEAARRRIIEPEDGRETARALESASKAWREAASWTSAVQLGGRAHEHHQAVKAVRDALTGPPLARLTLREKTHALRASISTAVTIGEKQAGAVTWLVNRGGLWVAHERPNLRPPGVARRHVKLDWEPMPWDHPAGPLLSYRANQAQRVLQHAAEVINSAVRPAAVGGNAADPLAPVENRILWETVETNTYAGVEEAALRMTPHRLPGIPR